MAELLSVHVHFPQTDDNDILKEKQKFQRNNSVVASEKLRYASGHPKKRNLDIEFRDLTYTVKDGNHKGKTGFYYICMSLLD